MFTIYGEKTKFNQWDLDQRVTCSCLKEGDKVVFKAHGKSIQAVAFAQNGEVWADVPNALLQKPGTVEINLGWGLDCHMDCKTFFEVEAKPKPEDYECNQNVKNRYPDAVRPDWNQNDCTAPDYVKNRPFYTEKTEVVVLEETQLRANENGGMEVESPIPMENGKTYTIVYNGKAYECVTREVEGVCGFGNIDLAMSTGNSGEPFFGFNVPGEVIMVIDTNGATSCTIAIYGRAETVHKIDEKYLPSKGGGGGMYVYKASASVAPSVEMEVGDSWDEVVTAINAGKVVYVDMKALCGYEGYEVVRNFRKTEDIALLQLYIDNGDNFANAPWKIRFTSGTVELSI